MKKIIHAVAGILQKENKLLIAERPPGKPYAGYWEFPGGKIEKNESGEQALKRELQEELGIIVLTAEFLFSHSYEYPDKKVELEIWKISEFSGEIHGKENQILLWSSLQQMQTLKLLEGNWPILKKLQQHGGDFNAM